MILTVDKDNGNARDVGEVEIGETSPGKETIIDFALDDGLLTLWWGDGANRIMVHVPVDRVRELLK